MTPTISGSFPLSSRCSPCVQRPPVRKCRRTPMLFSLSPMTWDTGTSGAMAHRIFARRTSTVLPRTASADRLLCCAAVHADAGGADHRPLSAAVPARGAIGGREDALATGLPARDDHSAAAEEQRYATGLVGKWHLGCRRSSARTPTASTTSSASRADTSTTTSTPTATEGDLYENGSPVHVTDT